MLAASRSQSSAEPSPPSPPYCEREAASYFISAYGAAGRWDCGERPPAFESNPEGVRQIRPDSVEKTGEIPNFDEPVKACFQTAQLPNDALDQVICEIDKSVKVYPDPQPM